jgi:hypothetical protein
MVNASRTRMRAMRCVLLSAVGDGTSYGSGSECKPEELKKPKRPLR